MIKFARFLAWLYLVLSVIASIVILVNYSQIEESYTIISTYQREVINPLGIGAGIGALFQGLIIYCLVMLTARIAENTAKAETLNCLDSKVDVNQPKVNNSNDLPLVPKDASKLDALHNAVWAGNYEIARHHILAGVDVNAKNAEGKTALELAAERNDKLLIELLQNYGAV